MATTEEQKQNLIKFIKPILDDYKKTGELVKKIPENVTKTTIQAGKAGIKAFEMVETAGKNLKTGLQKAVPEFINPKDPAVMTVLKNIPTVAARSAIEMVPTTPSEYATYQLGGAVLKGAGVAGKAVVKKTSPIIKKVAEPLIAKAEPFVKKAIDKVKPIVEPFLKKFTSKVPKLETSIPVAKPLESQVPLFNKATNSLTEERLSYENTKNLISAATAEVLRNPESRIAQDNTKRLYKRVLDAFGADELDVKDIPKILIENKVNADEFATLALDTISVSGKNLNLLSQLAKTLKKNKMLSDETVSMMEKTAGKPQLWDTIRNVYRKIDNPRRALMVTQTATAMRNFLTQGARYSLDTVEKALNGVTETLVGGKLPKDAFRDSFENVASIYRRFNKVERNKINQILDNNALEKGRLLSNIMGDITLGSKAMKVLNAPNILQENFYRKMSFDAKLHTLLAKEGKDIATATADDISRLTPQAVDHALDITFASTPKTGFAKSVLNIYREMPMLTTLHAFPRFWANATKFLTNYSPLGYAKFFNPKFTAQLASKNSEEATAALSKAFLGTSMLSAGFAIRNSKYAGEKWYEIKKLEGGKDTGKRIDMRAFAPFSTYLFLSEAMRQAGGEKSNLTKMDYMEGILSISRIAGTGLALVDWLRNENPTGSKKVQDKILGGFVGSYSVPARTWNDVISGVSDPEKIVRTTKLDPLWGPLKSSVPFLSRQLPKAYSPTRAGVLKKENPILKQATGIAMRTKNPLEIEIDRLDIPYTSIAPRTDSEELDLKSTKIMGSLMDVMGNALVKSDFYKNLKDDTAKAELVKLTAGEIRKQSVAIAKDANPSIKLLLQIKSIKSDTAKKTIIETLINVGKVPRKEFEKVGINFKRLGIK